MAVAALFSAYPTQGLVPLQVQFTDESTGSPDTWLWSFGMDVEYPWVDTADVIFLDTVDGIWEDYSFGVTSSDQNPIFTFETVGTYSITLIAELAGDEDTLIKTNYIIVVSNVIPRPSRLYSGVKEAYFDDGWENIKQFLVQQSSPFPCVIQYIDLFVETTNE